MKTLTMRRIAGFSLAGAAALLPGAVFAQVPEPGQIGFQEAATPIMAEIHSFHDWILLPMMLGVSLFVLALLLYCILRFNSKSNPTPRKFSHNTMIEVVWTVIPIAILLVIAVPSFRLLFYVDVIPDGKVLDCAVDSGELVCANDFPDARRAKNAKHVQVFDNSGPTRVALRRGDDYNIAVRRDEIRIGMERAGANLANIQVVGGQSLDTDGDIVMQPELTVKAVGYQWYWGYAYPEFELPEYFSTMLDDDQAAAAGEPRLLAVDNRIVVPVDTTVRMVVTAADVIHAWTIPAFGVKIDAVPGRINETWFKVDREGVYYGQCSELCGVRHAFMPIAVEVVSREQFQAWIDEQRAANGLDPFYAGATQVAQAN